MRCKGFSLRRDENSPLKNGAYSDILNWDALSITRQRITIGFRHRNRWAGVRRNVGVFLKNRYEQMREKLIGILPVLVFVFCVAQPLLDVAAYWQGQLAFRTPLTTLLRFGGFAGAVGIGFLVSDRKWAYFALAGILGAFAVARSMALMQFGYSFPTEDLMNLIQFYMLPIYTLAFCSITRKNPRAIRAVCAGFFTDLVIVGAVMILSRLTGTDPYTYPNKELGVQGWFLMGNPQSAILSMLVPVSMGWALTKWEDKVLPVAAVALAGELALYFLATRLSCMAMAACGIGVAVCLLMIDRKRWRQSAAIGLVTVVMIALLPVGPMVENQSRQADNYDLKQAAFDEIAMPDDVTADEQTRNDRLVEAYKLYVPGLVTKFGGERTLKAYNYSTNVDVMANRRNMRLTYCRLLLEDSPESARWFGMDITRMKVAGIDLNWRTGEYEEMVTNFDPENDFHAVYYLYGTVGLAMVAAFFVYLGGGALFAMFRDFKRHFTVTFAALAIGCCCALAHIVFTASTLRFINTQAYLAPLLAAMWSLSRRELSAKRMRKTKG